VTALMGAMILVVGYGAYVTQTHLAPTYFNKERPAIAIDLAALPDPWPDPWPNPLHAPDMAQPIGPPRQTPIPRQPVDLGQGFAGQIHHSYQVSGVVLTRQDYTHDTMAPVSPLDLGIGWGPLLDPAQRARYAFTNGRRRIMWRALEPGDRSLDLVTELSNNHLLPGSEAVRAKLLSAQPGMTRTLTGFLIDVVSPEGGRWRSSTKRTDYNFRGCEVILVTDVQFWPAAPGAEAVAQTR
jgi:hypothetical protein